MTGFVCLCTLGISDIKGLSVRSGQVRLGIEKDSGGYRYDRSGQVRLGSG